MAIHHFLVPAAASIFLLSGLSACTNAHAPSPERVYEHASPAPPLITPSGTRLPRFTPHVTVAFPPTQVIPTTHPSEVLPSPTPGPALILTATPTPVPQQFYNIYIVQPEETLYDIAQKFHISLQELAALNHITDPTTLRAGDKLRIP